ncbi:DUF4269 domain-containing protein [Shouchella xiaoxiensis]|nr:DUF4269 domain-containing protein [Shouchella xiaoxiensis]
MSLVNFKTIDYLAAGNSKQRRAFDTLNELQLLTKLASYNPVLCGTIPLEIDTDVSDLDIILDVADFSQFEQSVRQFYGDLACFCVKRKHIRSKPIIKVNFNYGGFEFELFGQNQTVTEQYAYLHMVIEHAILQRHPELRQPIINLKRKGVKTEPAFCTLLGLNGDPYEALLTYGRQNRMI